MIKRGQKGFFNILEDKRADSPIYGTVIFIILNLMFFVILIAFIYKSSTGALIYEQAYAKNIALLIDKAEPEMEISIDMTKAVNAAEKNNWEKEKIVKIDKIKNKVIVKLDSKEGYAFHYFSDYDINTKFDGNNLIINVKEKVEGDKESEK